MSSSENDNKKNEVSAEGPKEVTEEVAVEAVKTEKGDTQDVVNNNGVEEGSEGPKEVTVEGAAEEVKTEEGASGAVKAEEGDTRDVVINNGVEEGSEGPKEVTVEGAAEAVKTEEGASGTVKAEEGDTQDVVNNNDVEGASELLGVASVKTRKEPRVLGAKSIKKETPEEKKERLRNYLHKLHEHVDSELAELDINHRRKLRREKKDK